MKSIKLENGNKVKVFEKKELIEKLGFTEAEAKTIMKYQKQFPELLQDHKENDFIIDGRNLWEQLKQPQSDFSHWINRKVIKKGYKLNVDYSSSDRIVERAVGATSTIDYRFTVDAAKHIALSENTDTGREVRTYFILMERAIREMDQWLMVRHPEKVGYKQLTSTLNANYKLSHEGKEAPFYLYTTEADMINQCLLGHKAKVIRKLIDADDNITRDHFKVEVNQALYELQIMDCGLVMGNMEYEKRKEVIQKACDTKFIHIVLKAREFEEAI